MLISVQSTDRRKNIFPSGLTYIAACFVKYRRVKVFDLYFNNNIDVLFSLADLLIVDDAFRYQYYALQKSSKLYR